MSSLTEKESVLPSSALPSAFASSPCRPSLSRSARSARALASSASADQGGIRRPARRTRTGAHVRATHVRRRPRRIYGGGERNNERRRPPKKSKSAAEGGGRGAGRANGGRRTRLKIYNRARPFRVSRNGARDTRRSAHDCLRVLSLAPSRFSRTSLFAPKPIGLPRVTAVREELRNRTVCARGNEIFQTRAIASPHVGARDFALRPPSATRRATRRAAPRRAWQARECTSSLLLRFPVFRALYLEHLPGYGNESGATSENNYFQPVNMQIKSHS